MHVCKIVCTSSTLQCIYACTKPLCLVRQADTREGTRANGRTGGVRCIDRVKPRDVKDGSPDPDVCRTPQICRMNRASPGPRHTSAGSSSAARAVPMQFSSLGATHNMSRSRERPQFCPWCRYCTGQATVEIGHRRSHLQLFSIRLIGRGGGAGKNPI